MKEIKVTAEINPINLAIDCYENTVGTAEIISFRWSNTDWDVVAKRISIDCALYNVEDISYFAKSVMSAFYQQSATVWSKKISDLEERISKSNKDTSNMECDRMHAVLVWNAYSEIVSKIEAVKPSRFAQLIASAFTGDFVKGFITGPIADSFKREDSPNKIKKLISDALFNTLANGGEYGVKQYRINCNSTLYDDIRSRWYKGRKIGKHGIVNRTFDEDAVLIKREIILAVLEVMQKKQLFESQTEEPEEPKKTEPTADQKTAESQPKTEKKTRSKKTEPKTEEPKKEQTEK